MQRRFVNRRIGDYSRMADPRLYDPNAQVTEDRKFRIVDGPNGYRGWAEYAGALLCSDDPLHHELAGKNAQFLGQEVRTHEFPLSIAANLAFLFGPPAPVGGTASRGL